ncbi:PREDICTED: RNA/RNP complex-1-interacting phosphatase [Sturnus vulgaris]|uniref:RNA/RNP complex-1-interacting phosphatase n=1 Tax=Sturnus vulgaris TaxID=9172 RepID=UPI00071A5D23|nr:PREDICTED: RNA/RNP complex-1-interacting phosphatase [Sturnus vulgaris]
MAGRGACRVPERWTDYIPLGRRMPGTRFVAFKVPLKESFDQNLLPEDRFSPHDLIRKVEERKEELGLIIDLTYTTRYYGREELPPTLRYSKILTMGREIPNRKTILRFKYLVKRFLTANKDNDKLIGVHCTHGLNRTGYLVCRYLIDVEGMDPNAAIELFNKCRGHPIERTNYIQDLQKRALKNSCEVKNLGSDLLRKKGSTPAKPQEQLVKHPQPRPSQPPLAVPRNPGSSKKKQWPGPTAQEQSQELGHRHGALEQGQLEQKQLKKLEQRQQKHLEQSHPEQKRQKKLEQRQQKKLEHHHLEQRQQKKLEHHHLEQNHLEQKQQKKLEHHQLEQKQQKKLEHHQLEQKQQKKLEHRSALRGGWARFWSENGRVWVWAERGLYTGAAPLRPAAVTSRRTTFRRENQAERGGVVSRRVVENPEVQRGKRQPRSPG